MKRCLAFICIVLLSLCLPALVEPAGEVRIGVLAIRGHEEAAKRWAPTAEYLNAMIPGLIFRIVPLDHAGLREKVASREIDFIWLSPGGYVELEYLNGATRILTVKAKDNGYVLSSFGAVIFSRGDRKDIRELRDLRGKSFMGIEENAFGWWMALREFRDRGVNPYRDFTSLEFAGFPMDMIVLAVRDRAVDAGMVRAGLLEHMAREGKIDLREFRILNEQHHEQFPFLHSTRLYPEWPLAKLAHTPEDLAKKVAVALLGMPPDSPAAQAARIEGWTIPLDYHTVHDCLRELRVGPYKDFGKITPMEVLRRYWYWIILVLLALSGMAAVIVYILNLNRTLNHSREEIRRSRDLLEERVQERTADLSRANEDLRQEIARRQKAEEEQKKLEAQLRQAQKMDALGQLAGGIAHDFNNILMAITGYASLLQIKMQDNDPLRQYVDQIIASAERAAAFTQRLLSFSRPQAVNLRPIDLREVVQGIEGLLSQIIGEDIEFRAILPDYALPVMADVGQLDQVLMNLAVNARDAMPGGGRFTIEAGRVSMDEDLARTHLLDRTGHYAYIYFSDTGSGMDRKTQEQIFEPFFSTKTDGKGTGLGLSIVYGIIRQHKGSITVYSEPDMGTTFKIYLPLTVMVQAASRPETASGPSPGGAGTILVAEDDKEVRQMIRGVLEGAGYTVIEAEDGDEAVVKFHRSASEVSLLILDAIMPKKNCQETYVEIKRADPQVKAIFLSGYPEDFTGLKGILGEGTSFMTKPVFPRDLLAKVRDTLGSKLAG